MQRMVSFLLVAVLVVATLPHAGSVKCYECTGYDPTIPENDLFNNKNCPQDNFNASALATVDGHVCSAFVKQYNERKITLRNEGTIMGKKYSRDDGTVIPFTGYYCEKDFCNDQDPSAATPTRAHCLSIPLLLSLLTVLHLCLA